MATQLSPRQREILDLVAAGRTSKEIAVRLGISESTVNWHLANAFARLGASSRAEAVALSMRSNGLDHTPPPVVPARPNAVQPRVAWRLLAVALAIAVAGALLGGATVAVLRLGLPPPSDGPTAPPARSTEGVATASPAGPSHEDVVGDETHLIQITPDPLGGQPLPGAPANVLPAISAPPLPSLSVPLSPSALPTIPAVTPALPSLPVPIPTPLPTPPLPIP